MAIPRKRAPEIRWPSLQNVAAHMHFQHGEHLKCITVLGSALSGQIIHKYHFS